MTPAAEVLINSALFITAMMLVLWLFSLVIKNASIVDIAWGGGFVMVAWVSAIAAHGQSLRGNLLLVLSTLWGLRLAGYLAWRNIGHGEDFRYRAMRKHYGVRFPLISLVTVFAVQGALMWVVSLPLQLGQIDSETGVGAIAIAGTIIWVIGFGFESIGDIQLARFKAKPDSAGKVMRTGLWKYTRHPNYFGDSLVWWGMAIVAAESSKGRPGLIGAIAMTYLLMKFSGVPFLEKTITKRRPEYVEYQAATSAFFPRRPKR